MKVVHLTTVDMGEAAKAALRLNEALNLNGVTSNVITMVDVLKEKEYMYKIMDGE